MKSKDYINQFKGLYQWNEKEKNFLLDCETMHNAWERTPSLSLLHHLTLNSGTASNNDLVRIAVAYTSRCAFNFPLEQELVRRAIDDVIKHTLNPTAASRADLESVFTDLESMKFEDEEKYRSLETEINTQFKKDNFAYYQNLGNQRHTFYSVKLAAMDMIIFALLGTEGAARSIVSCAESARNALHGAETELQQCKIYRSIIGNPFSYISIQKKSAFGKLVRRLLTKTD
jgi:hypothetical protein